MSTETLVRQAVKGALALGAAGGMVGAGAALAQTAPAAGTSSGATNLSRIVVTGSHIAQTSIATAQPVITITRQEINASGFTTTGQLLQNLPSAQGALNVQFNNGGTGQEFINIHGLGSQRVLVLVDGQRWIPTLFGSVDLSTIPLAAVDRVEVLLNGASAVYGSEAIAGVINIITKKNYNGAEASAYMGIYDASKDGGGWDGKTQNYTFTVGTSGDRSSVLLSAGYYNQNPVWAGQRNISKEPVVGTGNSYGSVNTPGGTYYIFGNTGQFAGQGCGPTSYFGSPGCYMEGPLTGPDANPHPFVSANDAYNYAPLNYLLTPSERWYTYSQGHYDITDNVTFSFKAAYNRRNSHQVLAPNPWALGYYGYTANGLPIGVSASNPYNPFGVDLFPGYYSSATGAAWCAKYGAGAGGTCSPGALGLVYLGWRPLKGGVRDFNQNVQTFYFNGGFNGFWTMAGNQWSWNANYIYGSTINTQVTSGLASTTNLQKALGPLDQCQGSPDGCVPLNMFGGQAGQTRQQINYLLFTAHDVSESVVRDYNAGISGSFWNGWYAGPWSVAAGYEYYETDGYFSPDALIAAGNTVGNARKPTNGRINTNAQYAELVVPFASNVPGAKELNLDVAYRTSQFKWDGLGNVLQPDGTVQVQPTGGRAHSQVGRATLKWRPIEQLLFRASWSQGFRAPSLSELFFGVSDNYPGLRDPCAPSKTPGGSSAYGGWNPSTPLPTGCNGLVHTQPNRQIHTSIGGNSQLQPEKSITRSAGFVYSPKWAPGFDASADWYETKVTNNIARLGGQFYLDQCYLDQNASACQRVVLSGKSVTNILDLVNNGGMLKVRGWDIDLRYRLPTTSVGDFSLNLAMNFLQSDVNCDASGNCSDSAGSVDAPSAFFGQPMHRYNLGINWDYGPWSATWNVNLIGPLWENCAYGAGAGAWCSNPNKYVAGQQVGQNHLGTTIYHDVQLSYTVSSWNTTFSVGALNLFDKNPPISHTAFANSMLPVFYRIPGRFWYGRISVKF